jgi:general secretion pathway protein M
MDALKSWYAGLSEREQKLVSVGAGLGIVFILYLTIWAPLSASITTQSNALANEKETLVWVQNQSARAQILRQSVTQSSFSGSLTQLVNQTTRRAHIPVSRMQPQGDDLQVSIDQVAFNELLKWLDILEKQGVRVILSDVSEADTQGFVQVRRLQLGKA